MLQRADIPLRPYPAEAALDGTELEVSTAERRLTRELEKVLSENADSESGPNAVKTEPRVPEVRSVQDLEDVAAATDDFEWAAVLSGDAHGPLATDTAESWLRKAKRDRRRQKFRNFLGWVAATAIGGLIIGGAAYFMTGWTPDLDGLVRLISGLLS